MNSSHEIKLPSGLLLLIFLALLNCSFVSAQQRPNVLIILVDDMGYGDIGMSGNEKISTPNLDQLSTQSASFNNFYVSPVCAPTRASLLTGRYHQRTGVRSVTNGYETMNPAEVTIAELFSKAGYRTGIFGKWHLGEVYPSLPNAQGFDQYIGFRTGHTDDYFDAVLEKNGMPYPTKGYITDALTNEALAFIDKGKQPFLCYLPYNAPHTPLNVPDEYLKKYQGLGLKDQVARVYAMMENIDWNIGRIFDYLERKRLDRNTIVIFLSDNGLIENVRAGESRRFNNGLRDQKFSVYEGGIRTRFFIRWPGVIKPRTVDEIAAHIDLLPTLKELCNVEGRTLPLDGVSLKPLLVGQDPTPWPRRLLFENYSLATLDSVIPYPGGSVRNDRYKLINGKELYDLKTDPGETRNLAEERPEIVSQLDSAYRAWFFASLPGKRFTPTPIEIGHRKSKEVFLAPHLGRAVGNVQFKGFKGLHAGVRHVGQHPTGVDGDWATNWTSPSDSLKWKVNVVAGGRYDISLDMVSGNAKGGELRVCVSGNCIGKKIPDTQGRQPNSWDRVKIGTLTLSEGMNAITLTGTGFPTSDSQLSVGGLVLTRQ